MVRLLNVAKRVSSSRIPEECEVQGAIGHRDVLAADDGEIVVAGLDIAVGEVNVAAVDAIDAVVVRDAQVVGDADSGHHGVPAVLQVQGPVRGVAPA